MHSPLTFKIIERNYFALRSMTERDGLFQARIDAGNIEVAMARLRIDPGAEPTICLPEMIGIVMNECRHLLWQIRVRWQDDRLVGIFR